MNAQMKAGVEVREIRKYPNRRLYDVGESRYIKFKDLARYARDGLTFRVTDRKTGKDLTHAVMLQTLCKVETDRRSSNQQPLLPEARVLQLLRSA